jgi:hypothetical protein
MAVTWFRVQKSYITNDDDRCETCRVMCLGTNVIIVGRRVCVRACVRVSVWDGVCCWIFICYSIS